MSYNVFGPSDYRPQHAIWFQSHGKLRAFVSIVSNEYRYEIFNDITGKRLIEGWCEDLASAKREVFRYFESSNED